MTGEHGVGASRDGNRDAGGGVAIAPGVSVPAAMLRWSFSRSGGPGGQNVNKVATKAEVRLEIDAIPIGGRAKSRLRAIAGRRLIGAESFVDELGRSRERGGELVITSESERSQARNRSECLDKLRELLVRAMAEPKVRRATRPTRSSVERRIVAKKRRGDVKKGRRDGPD